MIFSELQAEVLGISHRPDLAAQVDNFTTHATERINRRLGLSLVSPVDPGDTNDILTSWPLLYIYATAIPIGFISPVVASALDACGFAGSSRGVVAAEDQQGVFLDAPFGKLCRQATDVVVDVLDHSIKADCAALDTRVAQRR